MTDNVGKLTLIFSGTAHLFSHLLTLLYGTVVLVLPGVFGVTYGEMLSVAWLGIAMMGFGALPAGWLGDRWSLVGMMAVFFIGTGLATIGTGFADSPFEIGVGLFFIGLFASIYHPVGVSWLIRNAKRRGEALGVNGIFGSIGVGGAAIVAGSLTDLAGWRYAFIVPGACCLGAGFVYLFYVLRGDIRDNDKDAISYQPAGGRDAVRVIGIVMAVILCSGMIAQTGQYVMPKLVSEGWSDWVQGSASRAGFLTAMVFTASMVAQYVSGRLADRFPLKWVYGGAYVIQVPVICLAAFLGGPIFVILMAMMMSANAGSLAPENAILARYASSRWRSMVFAAKFVIGIGFTALIVDVAGSLYDRYQGFTELLMLLTGFATFALIAIAFLPFERHEDALVQPAE
jgi:MFS family permease